jgi:ABC-type multidrug transport system fused ATPase/permease subunit
MRTYLHEILTLLGPNKKQIPRILLLFLLVSMIDLIGIGLIGPYVAIVADPQLSENTISNINIWFNLPVQPESLLTIMSIVLLGIFLLKSIAAVWINYIIIRFSANQQIRLRSMLMHSF